MIKSNRPNHILLILLAAGLLTTAAAQQTKRKSVDIFLDLRETNLDKPSTVAKNTLSERLIAAGFRVTAKRREADLIVEGSISSRLTPVTDEVKREGGVNAEATASVRLLAGAEVIATSVERSAPGDWGVQAERVGEDRLIEVAGRVADDMFSGYSVQEISGGEARPSPKPTAKPEPRHAKPSRKPASPNRGVRFMEVVWLSQNFVPEERIVGAVRKYGINFKPRDAAINKLRNLGISEAVINAVKTSNIV
ncbi:MAG: hypothetical protein ACREA2_09120 [Blastocatellia bacterium]